VLDLASEKRGRRCERNTKANAEQENNECKEKVEKRAAVGHVCHVSAPQRNCSPARLDFLSETYVENGSPHFVLGTMDIGPIRNQNLIFWPLANNSLRKLIGWCRQREKIGWQEQPKFDCRLVRTIFIFCYPSGQ